MSTNNPYAKPKNNYYAGSHASAAPPPPAAAAAYAAAGYQAYPGAAASISAYPPQPAFGYPQQQGSGFDPNLAQQASVCASPALTPLLPSEFH